MSWKDEDKPAASAPFAVGSDTSEEAAMAIEGDLAHLERVVYAEFLKSGAGGATCDEIERRLGMRHQTCSARVHALDRGAAIVDSGERRKTRSGRRAAVYVAAPFLTDEMKKRAAAFAASRAIDRQVRQDARARAALTAAERAELQGLRAEVAVLRARVEDLEFALSTGQV